MKKYIILFIIPLLFANCESDEEFLDREPTDILSEEQIYNNPDLVVSVLADLYNRYYDFGTVEDWPSLAMFPIHHIPIRYFEIYRNDQLRTKRQR